MHDHTLDGNDSVSRKHHSVNLQLVLIKESLRENCTMRSGQIVSVWLMLNSTTVSPHADWKNCHCQLWNVCIKRKLWFKLDVCSKVHCSNPLRCLTVPLLFKTLTFRPGYHNPRSKQTNWWIEHVNAQVWITLQTENMQCRTCDSLQTWPPTSWTVSKSGQMNWVAGQRMSHCTTNRLCSVCTCPQLCNVQKLMFQTNCNETHDNMEFVTAALHQLSYEALRKHAQQIGESNLGSCSNLWWKVPTVLPQTKTRLYPGSVKWTVLSLECCHFE